MNNDAVVYRAAIEGSLLPHLPLLLLMMVDILLLLFVVVCCCCCSAVVVSVVNVALVGSNRRETRESINLLKSRWPKPMAVALKKEYSLSMGGGT